MNVYCVICKGEMEIMEDLGTELRVYPCKCQKENNEINHISATNSTPQVPPRDDTQALLPLWRN